MSRLGQNGAQLALGAKKFGLSTRDSFFVAARRSGDVILYILYIHKIRLKPPRQKKKKQKNVLGVENNIFVSCG